MNESDINIGLLEFKETDEYFIKLGKMVWESLNRKENRKTKKINIDGKEYSFSYQEVIVHGT